MGAYASVIHQALVIYPLIVLLFTVPYVLYNYHKYGSVFSLRIIIVYSFVLYMLCVYCLVILPLPSETVAQTLHGRRMQLVPFCFIRDILRVAKIDPASPRTWLTLINNSAFLTTLFNLFMTMPFGMYMRYYFRKSWKQTLVLSFCLSLFFELTQLSGLYFIYPGSYRLFDVDDLIVNTAGGMAGYAAIGPLMKLLPARGELDQLSYRRGVSVSFLRRLMAVGIDLLVVGVLALAVAVVLAGLSAGSAADGLEIVMFVYFGFIPMVAGGQTLGKRMTSIRIVSRSGKRAHWYQYVVRFGSLYLVMQWLPWEITKGLNALYEGGTLSEMAMLVLSGIVVGAYLFYPLFASVMMTMHKPLFYEKISRTQVVSTVKAAR